LKKLLKDIQNAESVQQATNDLETASRDLSDLILKLNIDLADERQKFEEMREKKKDKIKGLKEDIMVKDEMIGSLESELEDQKEILPEDDLKNQELSFKKNEQLVLNFAQAQVTIKFLEEQYELEKEKNAKQEENLQSEISLLKKQLAESRQLVPTTQPQDKNTISSEEITRQVQTIAYLQKKEKELDAQVRTLAKENVLLFQSNLDLQKVKDDTEENLKKISANLSEKQQQISDLEGSVAEKQQQISDLEGNVAEKQQQISNLEGTFFEKDQLIEHGKKNLDESTEIIQKLNLEISRLSEEKDLLNQERARGFQELKTDKEKLTLAVKDKIVEEMKEQIMAQLAGKYQEEMGKITSEIRLIIPEAIQKEKQKLADEMKHEIEDEMKQKIIEEMRPGIEQELRQKMAEEMRPIIEQDLRQKMEEEMKQKVVEDIQQSMYNQLGHPKTSEGKIPKLLMSKQNSRIFLNLEGSATKSPRISEEEIGFSPRMDLANYSEVRRSGSINKRSRGTPREELSEEEENKRSLERRRRIEEFKKTRNSRSPRDQTNT